MPGGAKRSGMRVVGLALVICIAAAGLIGAKVQQASQAMSPASVGPSLGSLYARVSLDLESRFQTRTTSEETVITLGPGGHDVRFAGDFSEGVAARLQTLLEANPSVLRIHLTSEGGLVDEGEAVGALIASRGLTTYVPDYCVSACTLAFVRGRERLVLEESRLGFHAPYEPGLFGQDFQAESGPERAAYIAAGVAPEFVDEALSTPSEDLWIPDTERLVSSGVATGIVDLNRFPDSTLDDGPTLARARAVLVEENAELARLTPESLDAIASWYLDAYRQGLSEQAVTEEIARLSARHTAPPVLEAAVRP